MTSSASRTEKGKARRPAKPPRPEGRRGGIELVWIARASALLLIVIGAVIILRSNRWHVGAPVVFLNFAWIAIVGSAWFLWRAAWMAANDDPSVADDFWQPEGGEVERERAELEQEKRTLLKAIKEIEFDHQLGKMSDADAEDLIRVYRARAIEVIKAMDANENDATLSIQDRIAREVRARLAVEGAAEAASKASAEKAAGNKTAASEPAEEPV